MKFTIGINPGNQVRLKLRKKYTVKGTVIRATAKTATVAWPDGKEETYHKTSLRKIINPIKAIRKKVNRLIGIFTLLALLASTTGNAQSKPYDPLRAQITVGAINLAYMAYMNQKQNFVPVETQKWLNIALTIPVITFTFYKAIEYDRNTRIRRNYRPPVKKYTKFLAPE